MKWGGNLIKQISGFILVIVLVFFVFKFNAIAGFFGSIFDKTQDTYENVDDYFFREGVKTSYVQDNEPHQIASDGLNSFGFTLSENELKYMSTPDKVKVANDVAKDLKVFKFQYKFFTEFTLDEFKLTDTKLIYDGVFMDYDFSQKWMDFYGLNIFGSSYYDVVFKSDVYVKGFDFPLNYKEDTYFEYYVEDKVLQTWDMFFDGEMQLVLPDKNNDDIADDIDLVLNVQVSSKGNEGDVYNHIFKVPIKIINGVITQR